MDKDYLTVDELCEWLKISRSTVERWRKKGLPFIKTTKLVRFDKEKVQEWLESQEK